MKHKHLFLSLFCALFLLAGCTEVKREYYRNGKLKSETHYRFGKETGTTTYYHENYPTKTMEVEMKKGKRHGKFIKRYFDGNIELEAFYKNDLLEGAENLYYKEGIMSVKTHYKNGIKHGPATSWFPNGIVRESGAFVDGLFDGEWINHDERGMMIGEGSFVRGTGHRISYDEMGRLKVKTHIVNNKKEGLETYYFPSGEIEKTILFKEDRIIEINGVPIENL